MKNKIYDSRTGIFTYRGYKIRPSFNRDEHIYIGSNSRLKFSVTGNSLEKFANNMVEQIDNYITACHKQGIEPTPPPVNHILENREFDTFCLSGSFKELLKSKNRIVGWTRSLAIADRADLSPEEKKALLPKSKHFLIK